MKRWGVAVAVVGSWLALWSGCSGGDSSPPESNTEETSPFDPASADSASADGALDTVRAVGLLSSPEVSQTPATVEGQGAVRLASSDQRRWLSITPLGRTPAPAQLREGHLVYSDGEPDTDVVITLLADGFEEHRVLRSDRAPAAARYNVQLGPDLRTVRERHGRIEVLDRRGRVAAHTRPAVAVDQHGIVRQVALEVERDSSAQWIVTASLERAGLVAPIVVDPNWILGPTFPDGVITSLNSTWIRQNSSITGSIANIDASSGPVLTDDAEIVLGADAVVNGNARADSLRLKLGATLTGSAHYNDLVNSGTITGSQITPVAQPLSITIPEIPSFAPGTSAVTLEAHEDLTLGAGDYGAIKLEHGSAADPTILTLSGGIYEMVSLDIGQRSRIECAAPCQLRIQDKLLPGQASYMGPAPSSSLTAADVEIFVTGQNGTTGTLAATPKAATIGDDSQIFARIVVPNGTLLIGESTEATGTFIGRDVQAGLATTVVKDEPPDEEDPDCPSYCADSLAAACPEGPADQATCELDCEAMLGAAFCSEQAENRVLCANQSGTASCTPEGEPTFAGCEDEDADHAECEEICSTDDNNPCTEITACNCTPAACDPETAVTHTPVADDTTCDDASLCTTGETCQAGTCTAESTVVCSAEDQCHNPGTCDPLSGLCDDPPKPNGSSCNDADACTQTDACQAGTCTGANPVLCSASDQCHDPGTCNPGTGTCSNPPKPDGSACTDDNACTQIDACAAGTCTGSSPVVCSPQSACHLAGTCSPSTGACDNPSAPTGTTCDDANACTAADACNGAGTCTAGTPIDPDDANPCTIDACDPQTGTSHTPHPAGTDCGDDDICNGDELCDGAGTCEPGAPLIVDDDQNPCTADTCDPILGVLHTPEPLGTSCADLDDCDGEEICDGFGACQSQPPVIDDGNPATLDICWPDTGLVHHASTAIDRTVGTSLYDSMRFLFEGADPAQRGVAAGTIDPLRIAILRGRVLDNVGAPLPGVTISILALDPNSPDYGHTLSQGDGSYMIAANGGGKLTVVYEKDGYPMVQRTLESTWTEWSLAPDVVMTPFDTATTAIDFSGSATELQVHRATRITDAFASRQATLFVNPGTTAELVMPNGSTQPAPMLHVRATEYTVGDLGPRAMPAELPPTSQYTYALELSADEEVAAGAVGVDLNQPIVLYVENLLGLDVRSRLPVGAYDRSRGEWVAEEDGIVLAILSETLGMADIDLDGDGIAEGLAAFTAAGITDDERVALADLYDPGAILWRVERTHFSDPVDVNQLLDRGEDDCAPPCDDNGDDDDDDGDDDDDKDCGDTAEGYSTIECQNQILGESVPVTGTPFMLHYKSDRVSGRRARYELEIPLTPDQGLPPTVIDVLVEVQVAGRRFSYTFPCQDTPTPDPLCAPDSVFTFTDWDGTDELGRELQGAQPALVRVGYTYFRQWGIEMFPFVNGGSAGGSGTDGFGAPSPRSRFGRWPSGTVVDVIDGATVSGGFWLKIAVWTLFPRTLGAWSSLPFGLGGWSLSPHHGYNPASKTIYFGDGRRRTAKNEQNIIKTIAGADGCTLGNNVPALSACVPSPKGIDVGPDGGIYFATISGTAHLVRRIDPNGIITTIAGGPPGFNGDGIPATSARLTQPIDVAVAPDGSIYISDSVNDRVRRIDTAGIINTVAGTGVAGFTGDGGPATAARINTPTGIDIGPDGTIFFVDSINDRIRAIYPDGTIDTVAGGGGLSYSSATFARDLDIANASDVIVAPTGQLYFPDISEHLVFRIELDGTLTRIAGIPNATGFIGNGGPATAARLSQPQELALAENGDLYIITNVTGAPQARPGVRRVTSDGIIDVVIGARTLGCGDQYCGEGGPAASAHLDGAEGITVAPDGSVLITHDNGDRITRVALALPSVQLGNYVLPSADASELYIFDSAGRHLETRDPLQGHTLFSFHYDIDGRLDTVTDIDGRDTAIVHDASGSPLRILAPFGHETELLTFPTGYLSSIANPLSQAVTMTYHPGGLLESFTDPRAHSSSYAYDEKGYLILAERAETGSSQTMLREPNPTGQGRRVTRTTAQGRVTVYDILEDTDGSELWTTVGPDGVPVSAERGIDEVQVTTRADGSASTTRRAPNPRYAMLAPFTAEHTMKTAGHTLLTTRTRDVTLTNPSDPTTVETLTDTVTINGKTFTTTFDNTGPVATLTRVTEAGRTTVTELDDKGRPTRIEVLGTAIVLAPTEMEYDDGSINPLHTGLLRAVARGTGPSERRTAYFYDSEGNLEHIEAPLGQTTSFTYDGATRLTSTTTPDSEVVRFFYDAAGNLETLAQPGSPTMFAPGDVHQLSSEPRNLLESYTAPDVGLLSHTTSYDYSADGDLELTTRPDALALDHSYDSAGRLSQLTTPDGTIDYFYFGSSAPEAGKLEAIVSNIDGVTLEFAYDESLLSSTTWTGAVNATLAVDHDDDLRVASDTVAGTTIFYAYGDPDGLLTQAGDLTLTLDPDTALLTGTSIGALTSAIGYNEFAEPTHIVTSDGATPLHDMTLSYDNLGRIVFKTETTGAATIGYEYRYDAASRLEEVHQGSGDCSLTTCALVESYTYDENGNRTSVTDTSATTNASYDAQDRLLTFGTTSYTYTPAGELLDKTDVTGTTSYTYDVLGNLREVTLPTGTSIEYLIDGQNRRVAKLVDGLMTQAFVYAEAPGPIAELAADGVTLEARFVYATRGHVPDYVIKGGNTYRLVTDQLGSVRLVVDVATGAVAQEIVYDAWGRVLSDTNPGFQPFGFAGGVYDADTGLVRFGARDYDAVSARWTSKDPIGFEGDGPNLYAYVRNNPVNFIDPSGLITGETLCSIVVNAAALGCTAACAYLIEAPPALVACIAACFGAAAYGLEQCKEPPDGVDDDDPGPRCPPIDK